MRAARRAPLAELRAIELDENTEREDLDTFEASKEKLAAILQVEARLRQRRGYFLPRVAEKRSPASTEGQASPKPGRGGNGHRTRASAL